MRARPRALLFDWDNTLVDSWATIHEAWVHTLEAMGHRPWTLEETRANVRKSLRDSLPAIFGGRWEEARALYLERFTAIHLDRLTPLPGAVPLLRSAKEEGIWLGVVSNKTGPILRREAERLGWTSIFGRIVGAADAKADKPDPAVVELALEGSGVPAGEDVWLVGDTGIDMECALNAGCVPVLVRPEASDAEEFQRFPPAHTFPDLDALALYLSRGL
ncbi:MAG: HAD family hydrolase [Rhodospirillales bacterium]|nr:HAD family hydrolase [Rhodospirillales bacterium]